MAVVEPESLLKRTFRLSGSLQASQHVPEIGECIDVAGIKFDCIEKRTLCAFEVALVIQRPSQVIIQYCRCRRPNERLRENLGCFGGLAITEKIQSLLT